MMLPTATPRRSDTGVNVLIGEEIIESVKDERGERVRAACATCSRVAQRRWSSHPLILSSDRMGGVKSVRRGSGDGPLNLTEPQ